MTAESLATTPFAGRYWLNRRLAVGGMAEIYLARQEGPSGFDKDVVIKRLRPELCDDARVLAMFRDEARLGALINHPNTVHVYDVGTDQGAPFIAMEYIHGEELSDLCRRGLSLGAFLPQIHAVELIRQAALSLGHFHAQRDRNGLALSVVHCDISPTNLLVTEDGYLKVIDFGIARYDGQEYRDEAAVPGKLSYMSPEQASRETLDHRSDIYSLGIVLYELTVGQRLFRGPASEVAQRLVAGDVKPPTFISQDYPGALESIVMRTLERRPSERYPTAFDLADDLALYLADSQIASGPIAVARYLDQLAVAGGGQRRAELVSEAEALGGDDDLDFDRGGAGQLATSTVSAEAAAQWEEIDEDEQAVADALGIGVHLVRTQIAGADTPDDSVDVTFDDSLPAAAPITAPPATFDTASMTHGGSGELDAAQTRVVVRAAPERDLAPTIRPLDPPGTMGPVLVGIAIGGVLTFIALHFLM